MLLLVVVCCVVLVAQGHPLGAPDTFTLFHPVLPGRGQKAPAADRRPGQQAADTGRTVPIFHLPPTDGEKVGS